MRHIILSGFFLSFFLGNIFAQESPNLIKLNVLPLIAGNVALEFEKPLTPHISASGTISWRPNTGLPFKSLIESLVDEETSIFDDAKMGAFSLTPEVRFYLSKKETLKGFYIAPYIKYSKYSLKLNIITDHSYSYEGQNYDLQYIIPATGSLNAFTAGFSVGSQWQLADAVYLDWRIIGPGFGFSKGKVAGKKNLDPMEQDVARQELEGLKDLPIMKIDYEVNNEGVNIHSKGPFAGIRTALSIGYRF